MLDLSAHVTQKQFGELVGISQQAVSDLVMRGVLSDDGAAGTWLLAYCGHLREVAAGRAGSGDLDLVEQRARLAAAQAEKVEMANAVTRGELTPTVALEQVLAGAASKIAGILDAIPGMVRRRVPSLTSGEIDMIAGEVAKARNTVAGMSLADLKAEDAEDSSPTLPPYEDVT